MANWHNDSGKPLSSLQWLMTHHQAKLPERIRFAKRLAEYHPKVIVDLGCGPGIWLNLLNQHMAGSCQFIGLDADSDALSEASRRAAAWQRDVYFQNLDIDQHVDHIPSADMYLAFNIFPYLADIASFMDVLKHKLNPGGCIVIRQYDGSMLRLGPMAPDIRAEIDLSLQAAILHSEQFRHYDLDRVFTAIQASAFEKIEIEFEVCSRATPYPPDFIPYLKNTIEWTRGHISDKAGDLLDAWIARHIDASPPVPSYFSGTDLVAIVS